MNVEIKEIGVYEKDNGFEITALVDKKKYRVYAQLPNCPDSQHAFLDKYDSETINDGDEILESIVEEVEESYTELDLAVFCKLGLVCNFEYKEMNDYYVVVEKDDVNNYIFAKKNTCSSYYKVFLLEGLSAEEENDSELMNELRSLLRDLQIV